MSSYASASGMKSKKIRRKKAPKRRISKKDENILRQLGSDFNNIFNRTLEKINSSNKQVTEDDETGKKSKDIMEKYCAAVGEGRFENILLKLARKPYYISIKGLEKILEKMQMIFRYQKDKTEIFSLSPIHILTKPFTFIKPNEKYLSFDKACSVTEKLGLDYEKWDVFCAYLYQITTVHKNEAYTPYIEKINVKKFYKFGINDSRNKRQYKLPEWCNYTSNDKKLLNKILQDECKSATISDKQYIVLNYIYEMENKSNKYLSEFIELKDTRHQPLVENSENLIESYEVSQDGDFHFTQGQKEALKQITEDRS